MPAHNETGCRNAGDLRTPALTLPDGARGQIKRQQVNPALQLPAGRNAQKYERVDPLIQI